MIWNSLMQESLEKAYKILQKKNRTFSSEEMNFLWLNFIFSLQYYGLVKKDPGRKKYIKNIHVQSIIYKAFKHVGFLCFSSKIFFQRLFC